jgi:hypothetical protein
MAVHSDITRKSDVQLALDTANAALGLAAAQLTKNAGGLFIPDGTGSDSGTLIGAVSANGGTVAQWVNDMTVPGKPTGLSAECHLGVVSVMWDGSLDGGVPPDFSHIGVRLDHELDGGGRTVDLIGSLVKAGSVASGALPVGSTASVWAVAFDDAHDADGNPAPHESDMSDIIQLTVVDESADMLAQEQADIAAVQGQVTIIDGKAAAASAAADAASAKADQVRSDAAADTQSVREAAAKAQSDATAAGTAAAHAQSDATAFGAVADKAATDIDAANTKITTVSDKVDGLSTTISNTTTTANDALSMSTQTKQDLQGVSTTASQAYSDSQQSLSRLTKVEQTASGITATLSSDYQKKTDADKLYATQTQLTATADGITSQVSQTYLDKSSAQTTYATVTKLSQTADALSASIGTVSDTAGSALTKATNAQADLNGFKTAVSTNYVDKTSAANTYATQSALTQTASDITSQVTSAASTANSALDKATTVSQTVDGLTSTVSAQASTLDGAVSNISSLQQTATSLSSSISQTSGVAMQALANAQELLVNGGFETGDLTGWKAVNAVAVGWDQDNPHSGAWQARLGAGGTLTQTIGGLVSGQTYRCSYWQRGFTGRKSAMTVTFPGGSPITVATLTGVMPYTLVSGDVVVPDGAATMDVQLSCDTDFIRFDDVSVQDVTGIKAAQQSADTALTTATTAQQDLNGFKTTVSQTYDTKSDATSRESVMTQDLNGFKASVQKTYLDKTTASSTYPTKSDVNSQVTQSAEQITSQVAAKYQTQSAMGGYPTTSKMTSAISQSKTDILSQVSGTYQTVNAMSGYPTLSAMNSAISQSATGVKSDVSNMYVTTTQADSKYATQSALAATDGKADASNAAANLALTNAENLVVNGSGRSMDNTWSNKGVTSDGTVFSRTFPGGENHVDFFWGGLSKAPIQGRVYRLSIDVRLASGVWPGGKFVFGVSRNWTAVDVTSASSDWTTFTLDYTVPASTDNQWFMSSYMSGNAGSGVIQFRNLSVKDVTEVAQLGDSIASTYVSNSSFQQKSDSLLGTVNGKYASGKTITQRFSALEQTDSSFSVTLGSKVDKTTADNTYLSQSTAGSTYLKQSVASSTYATQSALQTTDKTANTASSNASNAQNRVGTLETCLMMTADGVRVGKISSGKFVGYSTLVNSAGSYDILNSSGNTISRFTPTDLLYSNGSYMMNTIDNPLNVTSMPSASVGSIRSRRRDTNAHVEYVKMQNTGWNTRTRLLARHTFEDTVVTPRTHLYARTYYDAPSGLVSVIVDWDDVLTNLPKGNNSYTMVPDTGLMGNLDPLLLPMHISSVNANSQFVVMTGAASIITLQRDGSLTFSTTVNNNSTSVHTIGGVASWIAAGGAWLDFAT